MNKMLKINEKKKKKTLEQQKSRCNSHWTGVMTRVSNILMIILPLVFLLYAYFISDGFVYLHDRYNSMGDKNTPFIITIAIILFILLLIMKISFRVVLHGYAGKNIVDRFAETISVSNEWIQYGYKCRMHATSFDRVVVDISFRQINRIIYDEKYKKLIFSGVYTSTYYSNYELDEIEDSGIGDQKEFIIYDYFEPSLYTTLFDAGLDIKKLEE